MGEDAKLWASSVGRVRVSVVGWVWMVGEGEGGRGGGGCVTVTWAGT